MSINRPELGATLKRARERVRPEDVGLPAGRHRRVVGLRREEVAMLAGVSVDYVVRLEQGRGPHPSAQVVGALVRALRLEDAERDHVFALAGVAAPQPGRIDLLVRPRVLRLLDRFTDLPVLVRSAKVDVLAWNAMSSALHGDWSALRPERRNQYRLHFLPDAQETHTPMGGTTSQREDATRHIVAGLRITVGRYPDDPDLATLVADLLAGSPRFAAHWADVGAAPIRAIAKILDHPAVGTLHLDCDTLLVPEVDQSIVVYSAAPGTRDEETLALLRVVGTQSLAPRSLAPTSDS